MVVVQKDGVELLVTAEPQEPPECQDFPWRVHSDTQVRRLLGRRRALNGSSFSFSS